MSFCKKLEFPVELLQPSLTLKLNTKIRKLRTKKVLLH